MRNARLLFYLSVVLILSGVPAGLWAAEDLLEKGISEYKAENFEEALVILLKAKEQQPDSALASFYLGLTYKQVGKYKESAGSFEEAIKLPPSVQDAYPELIEMLYNMNELREAGAWIARAEKEGIRPATVAFLKGEVLAKEGRTGEAIGAFQKAKELDISLSQTADFQIALLYAKEKKFSEAKEVLKAVIAAAPATEIASFAREYESAMREMETRRPWRFTAGAAYQYDSNVVLTNDAGAVAVTGKSDRGLIASFRADYSNVLNEQWFLNAQYNLFTDSYSRIKSHNLIVNSLSVSPGLNIPSGAVTLPLYYSYTLLQGDAYMSYASVRPTWNVVLNPENILLLTAGYARRELLQTPVVPQENRDGNVYSLSVGYAHPFSGNKGLIAAGYEFSRDITEGINWTNTGNRIYVSGLFPLSEYVKLVVSGEAFLQNYTNVNSLADKERRDRIYFGSADVIWEISKMVKLNLQYSHTTADSNIHFYAYRRDMTIAGIEFNF